MESNRRERPSTPRRTRHLVALLGLAAAIGACDQPTAPHAVEAVNDPALISFVPSYMVDCSDSPLAGDRWLSVRVKLSTYETMAGIVVAVISPEHGVLCYGATNADGQVKFANLKQDAAVLLSVRDEVSLNAMSLEIVPPNPVGAAQLADEPSLPGNRQEPALVGGASCTDIRALTWATYDELRFDPCKVNDNSVTLVMKGHAPQLGTRVLDASNQPLAGVLVAALSPATTTDSDLPTLCAVLPWIDQFECLTNSNGPALLQSLGLTDADGRISLGVSFGGNGQPVVIETIAEEGGQTLFGTLFETTDGVRELLTSPGMCTVETVMDGSQPSGTSQLDIISSAHSVGLSTSVDPMNPLSAPALIPVPGTLVVKLNIHATPVGGAGSYTLQYRLGTGGMNTVRASFAIDAGHPDMCTVSAGSGNGLGGGVEFQGHCAPNTSQPADMESGRRAYTLFFVVSGVDGVSSAQYNISTDRDHLDPSRSDPAYLRGGVNFTGLNAAACPVRLNNDGRWIAL
jgi:hypothetical protein